MCTMDCPVFRASSCSPDQEAGRSLKIYREVFDLCDKDGNGFIGKSELSNICEQFSDGVVASALLDSIKVCLGSNHDDHISFEEFKAGFELFQQNHLETNPVIVSSTPHKKTSCEEVYESEPIPDEEEGVWREVADRIDPQGTLASTGVRAVWKELNQRDPALLENFEGFLTEIITELKQSDIEKNTLQTHVKRILEQHSREVSEMDSLLQEELQLAKASHQQTNASQTSRLSNHYSSLLAQREATIDELATQESDLKRALHNKVVTESQLKQEKDFLLTANKVLQEKLETNNHSNDGGSLLVRESNRGNQQNGRGYEDNNCGLESEDLEADINPLDTDVNNGADSTCEMEHSNNEIEHPQTGLEQGHGLFLDSNLCLDIIQELHDGGQEEIKYYPPKKSPLNQSSGASTHTDEKSVQEDSPRQLFLDNSQGGGYLHGGGQSPSQAWRSPQRTKSSGSSKWVDSSNATDQGSLQDRVCSTSDNSHKVRSAVGMKSNQYCTIPDASLSISGVMPRREDLPRPSSPLAVSRVFKVIFLGDAGVGKSSLIAFLTEGKFQNSVVSTVGLDYRTKTLRVGEERVVFQLWDTAGQERFNSILTPVYFRRADAFIIVYDVTDVKSFKSTKKWISVIKAALRENPPVVMLVGNKSDKDARCVAIEDGRRLALELKALFSETSAMSGDNVLQAHSTLAQLLLSRENAYLQEIRKHSTTFNSEKGKCSC